MRASVLAALTAAAAAAAAFAPARAADETPAAVSPAPAPTVTVAPATIARVEGRVPLSGTLVARQAVQVYPQVSGFEIVALNAEAGDHVTRGQELARLEDATLSAQLAQAEAELQRAVAGVSQAESQITSAEAARTQAVTALDRARSLRRSGSGTQAALDQAIATEAAAQASAASATDGLAVARATQAQAEAARGIARLNLDRTRVLSPVDGRVTARAAQLGGVASAAGEPMFTLIADGTVEFDGEVIETALPDLEPGDAAEIDVAGVGRIEGQVRLLPGAVDATTRLGRVRVSLPADDRLLTGLFASGDIITVTRDAVTVPSTAVLSSPEGDRVQVVRDGVVETRGVTAGLLWQGRREILDGVAEGEEVIIRAGAFFSTGDQVNAIAPASAESAVGVAGEGGAVGAESGAGADGAASAEAAAAASDAQATRADLVEVEAGAIPTAEGLESVDAAREAAPPAAPATPAPDPATPPSGSQP